MQLVRGEIYQVDFGRENIKGSEQRGIRPALFIQNGVGDKYSSTTIVASITKKEPSQPTHVKIDCLSYMSIVACEQIRTIDKSRILSKKGKLTPEKLAEVDKALKVSMGIGD